MTAPDIQERDVAISHYSGADNSGRGVTIKFRMADGRHEVVFTPSALVGWLSDRLTDSIGDMSEGTPTDGGSDQESFLSNQPDLTSDDLDASGRTMSNVETHVFSNCVALLISRVDGSNLTVAMNPTVTQFLRDYLEAYRRHLIDPNDADTSKKN